MYIIRRPRFHRSVSGGSRGARTPYHCRCQQPFRFRAHGPNVRQWFRQGSYRFVSCSWCPISLEPAHEATAWSSMSSFEQGWQFDRNTTREAGSGCDNTRVKSVQVRISICVAPQPQMSAQRPISQPFFASRLTLSAELENFVAAAAKHGKQALFWPGADVPSSSRRGRALPSISPSAKR